MKFTRIEDREKPEGVNVQGVIDCYKSHIKRAFGEPINNSWAIEFEKENVIAIITEHRSYEFNVIGFDSRAFYMVSEAIEAQKDIEERTKEFIENIVTDELINDIKELARYNGKRFYVGDIDVSVRDRGVFKQKRTNPKISFGKNEKGEMTIDVSKTETETEYVEYDVTQVKNNCRCTNHDTVLLVVERKRNDFQKEKDLDVFVYSINLGAKPERYEKHPSFKKFKQMFENKEFMHFNSLIEKRTGTYVVLPYNDYADRIFNLTALVHDLDYCKTERTYYE